MFNAKKKHFTKKLEDVSKMIWDLEFKREKTHVIREEIRQEYDRCMSRLDFAEKQLISAGEEMDKERIEQLNLDKEELLQKIDRFKKQMQALDWEVEGAAASEELPMGIQGINAQLDGLQELKQMLVTYIKKI